MLRDSHQRFDSIKTTLQHENLRTRAELRSEIVSLRDAVLQAIAGSEFAVTKIRPSTSPLNSENSSNLVNQVGEQLVRSPSSLKDACKKMDLPEPSASKHFIGQHRHMKCMCHETAFRKQSAWPKGPFSIEYDFRAAHKTECLYYVSHWRSWNYSLSSRLLPLMERAVQVTLTATLGAGGSSIGPSLRYFGIVERSKSPAFQLFDAFPKRCTHRMRDDVLNSTIRSRNISQYKDKDGHHPFLWDLELVNTEIHKLRDDLSLLLSTGRSSAAYGDEFGNTLLHVSKYARIVKQLAIWISNIADKGPFRLNWAP